MEILRGSGGIAESWQLTPPGSEELWALLFLLQRSQWSSNTVLVPMDLEPQPVTLIVLDDSHFHFGSLLVPLQCGTSVAVLSKPGKEPQHQIFRPGSFHFLP